MPKHKVIRTYNWDQTDDYHSKVPTLLKALDEGWKIIYSVPIDKGIEYVLQLPEPEISSSCKRSEYVRKII